MEAEVSTKIHRRQHENGEFLKPTVLMPKEEPKRKFTWGRSLKYHLDISEILRATHDLPKICTEANVKGTPIQEFYSGAHILITGATGFMGKFILEKLLVSCPKISKIYMLIREKKGLTVEERFDKLFDDVVFTRLKKMVPNYREKIVAITGDCGELRMGLADENYQRLNETLTHIFHGAATVRFDEKIRIATHINLRGVREMLEFSKKCKNLKSIVHISTAYANALPDKKEINEKFYPPKEDYKKLIELVESADEDTLTKMTPGLISPWPNTYAFTKQIAEEVIRVEAGNLPICIVRPAIVVASYKEPLRAYCDNIYGATGVAVGSGMGILRVLHCDTNLVANLVPVDTATNSIIAAAWKTAEEHQSSKSIKVYNYTSTERNPHTWGEYAYWNQRYGMKWGSTLGIWYPMMLLIKNSNLAMIATFFLHTIPAYLMDGCLFIARQETKMVKVYQKIDKFCDVIAYFCTRMWKFTDNNTLDLWKSLTSMDKEIFPFDIADVDWDFYYQGHIPGLRWHIVKDPPETVAVGRAKLRKLYVLHLVTTGLIFLTLLWMFTKIIGWSFF